MLGYPAITGSVTEVGYGRPGYFRQGLPKQDNLVVYFSGLAERPCHCFLRR